MPHAAGMADRLRVYLDGAGGAGRRAAPARGVAFGVTALGFDPDAFVHELVDGIVGDNYPEPDRMLVHAEAVVGKYLDKTMYAGRPPAGKFNLFAVEGGTAAMCYVFGSLMANRVLARGDTIALGTPIFTPYLEMPRLEDFGYRTIAIEQSEMADGRRMPGSTRTRRSPSSRTRRSRRCSWSTPATRGQWRCDRRASTASSTWCAPSARI